MKTPRKHAEIIKAWADGAEIQYYDSNPREHRWIDCIPQPSWNENVEFRIKPEPKPDAVKYMGFDLYENEVCGYIDSTQYVVGHWFYQLKLTFDGETDQLKSAEVI